MFDLGGTYRATSPAETLAKVEPLMSSRFGITRVANVTGLDNIGIPTYIAIRPLSKNLTTSQGKGLTHQLAKISAIMESIEGWHAEHVPSPDLIGSFSQLTHKHNLLKLDQNIRIANILNFTQTEMDSLQLPWSKGLELNSGEELYIPSSLIDLDYSHRCDAHQLLVAGSNGLASGNSYEEALCHALYEVIERDCEHDFVFCTHSEQRKIDLHRITSPHIKALLAHFNWNDISLDVYDITNDLGVPTFLARLRDLTGVRLEGFFGGSGCHSSSVIALSRAITEAVQSKVTMITGSRDDMYPLAYKAKRNQFRQKFESGELPVLNTTPPCPLMQFTETNPPASFSSCVDQLLYKLKRRGIEQVIIYDHTKADIGIPVVHVFIPGLKTATDLHHSDGYSHYEL